MEAIVTLCNSAFSGLLNLWYQQIRKVAALPVFVLCVDGFVPPEQEGLQIIKVNPNGNPFASDTPDFVCAEKLRLFNHLPHEVSTVLFIDVDVLVLKNFWRDKGYFEAASRQLVICPDTFVGYKEKMEDEFRPYDPNFRMKFNPDGSYFYFNTGLFFASRLLYGPISPLFLSIWEDYVSSQGKLPSVFDQNLINYCIIKYELDIIPLAPHDNCLRQYGAEVINGRLMLNGKPVNAYHFNGGDGQVKEARWRQLLKELKEG